MTTHVTHKRKSMYCDLERDFNQCEANMRTLNQAHKKVPDAQPFSSKKDPKFSLDDEVPTFLDVSDSLRQQTQRALQKVGDQMQQLRNNEAGGFAVLAKKTQTDLSCVMQMQKSLSKPSIFYNVFTRKVGEKEAKNKFVRSPLRNSLMDPLEKDLSQLRRKFSKSAPSDRGSMEKDLQRLTQDAFVLRNMDSESYKPPFADLFTTTCQKLELLKKKIDVMHEKRVLGKRHQREPSKPALLNTAV